MSRGGGGGGHSGGGSFGGRSGGSSFGHSSSSSHSSYGHSSYGHSSYGHSSYSHSNYGPGPGPGPHHYYGRPRRYYGSSRNSAGGCAFAIIVFMMVAVSILSGAINACQMATTGSSCSNSDLKRTTEKREKITINNGSTANCIIDEIGWGLKNSSALKRGMESFYESTGVQPAVYIRNKFDGWNNESACEQEANRLYEELFNGNEGYLLFVYFACPGDSADNMDGNFYYICGKGTETVMDSEAREIFEARYWHNYDDTSLTVSELFGKTFKQSGKAIMAGPIRMRNVILIICGIIGAVVIVALLFKWWKARKAQKNKENEDIQKILSTPLETFGNSNVNDLKDKYEENK